MVRALRAKLLHFKKESNLEVVPKGPISKHFKKCVVIDILSHII